MRAAQALAVFCVGCLASSVQASELTDAQRAELAIARSLDIDYRKCASVVISDQIRTLSNADTAYVTIMGEDPDKATLTLLRSVHARTRPYSQMPKPPEVTHSHIWSFYFGDLRAISSGEYMARAAFNCGTLCAAATEYRLRKSTDTCSIVSSRILWQS